MSEFFRNKFFRYLSVLLFFYHPFSSVKASSALASWALKSNGILELRTKSNTNLKAYFKKASNKYGDRFWIDFPGELKNPRTIKGNGPIKEIRLGKPNKGKTRLWLFSKKNNIEKHIEPLTWRLIGLDENRWRIRLFFP